MNQKKSLSQNAALNIIRSCLSVAFPLITYPYAFRTLHAQNIGKVDFSFSIVNYFLFFALLGIPSYAIREGAKCREDQDKINTLASELFSISIFSTALSYFLLVCFLFINPSLLEYRKLIAISSLSILFTTMGIDWVNTIYEDFFFITIRSIVTHVLSMVLLFLFVKSESDYYLYAGLTVFTNAIICFSNWRYCKRYVHLKFLISLNLKQHLKPILALFSNTIATSIYVNANITLLGWISGDYYVGIYSLSAKIYNVFKNIMSALYSVFIPRIAFYIGKQEQGKLKKLYTKLVNYTLLLLIPLSTGIIAVSKELVLLLGGSEYRSSILTTQLLGISLVGAILGGLMTSCFNIPLGRENYNFKASFISAALNVVLGFILIPKFNQNGAAFTIIFSEFFVAGYCIFTFKNISHYLCLKACFKCIVHALLGSASILVLSFIIHNYVTNIFFSFFTIIVISPFLYITILHLLQDETTLEIIKSIKAKLK